MVDDEKTDALSSGKRGKMEMLASIVAVALKPSNISRIMRFTNTNNSTISDYLKFMIEKRLIKKQSIARAGKNVRAFVATKKGIKFLKTYCDILKLLYGKNFLETTNDLAVVCLQLSKCPTKTLNQIVN
jgi:predicted transcriptional regulator